MNAPISVIVPLYNKEARVRSCLVSILSQKVSPQEIIVVDDGSTDNSVGIVQELRKIYPDKIKLIRQSNRGVSVARNIGITRACSRFVAFLDADDVWEPQIILKARRLIRDFPNADLYCFGHQLFDVDHGFVSNASVALSGFRGYVEDFFECSLKASVANSSKVIIRREALKHFGGFPEDAKVGEDLFVWMMLALNGRVAYDSYIGATIYQEPDSSRAGRVGAVPYPILYFSKRENQYILTESARKYLWNVHLKHVAGSLMVCNRKEAMKRLSSGFRIFGFKNFILIGLLIFPSRIFLLLRKLRRRASKQRQNEPKIDF